MYFLFMLACSTEKPTEKPKPTPTTETKPAAKPTEAVNPAALAVFKALPKDMNDAKYATSEALVSLGRTLYYETRLSKSQEISCNSCHQLDNYGVDSKPTSPGHKGQLGGRNSPTSYNAAGHFVQFWDGRAADVEAQAKGPVLNPVEMAMKDEASVVAVLKSIPGYAPLFAAAFPGEADPITYDNMAKAIGAFERGLVTPGSFDKYLTGDAMALSAEQKKGLQTFIDSGCVSCHSGAYVGGAMYQKLGLVEAWPNQKDQGRFDQTRNEADRMMFKVPSLRNIEKTGPYFHDGSVVDLSEAIKMMAKHQVGRELSPEQVAEIRAFLGALTGEVPAAYVAKPEPLAAGEKTPKADLK